MQINDLETQLITDHEAHISSDYPFGNGFMLGF